jgi:hypothetical protein
VDERRIRRTPKLLPQGQGCALVFIGFVGNRVPFFNLQVLFLMPGTISAAPPAIPWSSLVFFGDQGTIRQLAIDFIGDQGTLL